MKTKNKGVEVKLEVYKTLKIPINANSQIENLRTIWSNLVEYVLMCSSKFNLIKASDLQDELYHIYSKELKGKLYTYYIPLAFKTGSEMVRSCLELCKSNCRTRFPKVNPDIFPLILTRQVCQIFESNNELYAKIKYKPYEEPINIKLLPSKEHFILIQKALEGKEFKIYGIKLLKKDNEFRLHVSLKKEVNIPNWQECKTFIGIDIGMNYLVTCSAISDDNKIHKGKFIHGSLWKHLQLKKKFKVSKLQSKNAKTDNVWDKYNNMLDEQLHIASKEVIEYAKQFDKPIIVLEKLEGMKPNSFNSKWNFILSNWARTRLQSYIKYKADWEGIPVVYVYPHYTSQLCCYCGVKGDRTGKLFTCPNCGRVLNSDFNASVNIAKRFRNQLATVGITGSLNASSKGGTSIPQTVLSK